MHHHSKIRLSSAVALLAVWLATVSLGACSNPVPVGDPVLVGQACAAACEENPTPKGLDLYKSVSVTCVCEGCSDACTVSICDKRETPSDECLPCVQAALGSPGCGGIGHFGSCKGAPECQAIIDCLLACPDE
jgi:hypothetical protein